MKTTLQLPQNFSRSVRMITLVLLTFSLAVFAQAQTYTDLAARPQGGWNNMRETAVLSNDNGVSTLFGAHVAIDGTTIAVSEQQSFSTRGRVEVFTQPAGGWVNATPTGRINGSDTMTDSFFGTGLSVSGSTIVSGAYGNGNGQGAARDDFGLFARGLVEG
jgi:hypothetical protein